MLNTVFTSSWIVGGWLAVVAIIVAASMAMSAHLSTTVLLLAVGIAPAIVVFLLARGAPSPSVAEILRSVETKDGRS
jgi:hypothetical protein